MNDPFYPTFFVNEWVLYFFWILYFWIFAKYLKKSLQTFLKISGQILIVGTNLENWWFHFPGAHPTKKKTLPSKTVVGPQSTVCKFAKVEIGGRLLTQLVGVRRSLISCRSTPSFVDIRYRLVSRDWIYNLLSCLTSSVCLWWNRACPLVCGVVGQLHLSSRFVVAWSVVSIWWVIRRCWRSFMKRGCWLFAGHHGWLMWAGRVGWWSWDRWCCWSLASLRRSLVCGGGRRCWCNHGVIVIVNNNELGWLWSVVKSLRRR